MGGMKLPRFRLRTLLIAIALLSIPMGWVAYQLNWIRQRHALLAEAKNNGLVVGSSPAPGLLAVLGEKGVSILMIPDDLQERAHLLFPEADIESPYGQSVYPRAR
jgi:hypothetical protein